MDFEDEIGNTVHNSLYLVEKKEACLLYYLEHRKTLSWLKNYFNLLRSGALLIQDPSMFSSWTGLQKKLFTLHKSA